MKGFAYKGMVWYHIGVDYDGNCSVKLNLSALFLLCRWVFYLERRKK